METRDKIIEIIKVKGPVLPVQISKEIGSNILMASAHLAELTASSKLKISTIKVGGSPLYYLAGQEPLLQKYTGNMNDKEKKAFDLLSQNKVLRDSEQEPVIRVALREIKDFAKPLSVNYNNSKEIFWKWYLASDEEAEQLIKSKLDIAEKPMESKLDEKSAGKVQQESEEQLKEKKESDASELVAGERVLRASQVTRTRSQVTRKYKKRETEDMFLKDILKFFEKNKIGVINTETIKKNSEIDFIVEIPSVVGNLQYYCKAKNKKRVSDSDLSNAYVKGQFKKLPIIVIAPGDLSAKAQDMAGKELKNLTFKKI